MMETEVFKRYVASRLEAAQETIESFKKKLKTEGPAQAFRWGDGAVDAAGAVEVYQHVLKAIEAGKTPAQIRELAIRRVVPAAKHPARSTSVCHNLTEQAVLAAWAGVASDLESE